METYNPNHVSHVDDSPVYEHHEWAEAVEDRRELDEVVERFYAAHNAIPDNYSKRYVRALVRGGANALHRFGLIVSPAGGGVLRIRGQQ